MDFSEPVSIEQPATTAGESGQPERRAEDSLVINILAKQPCDPTSSNDGEIVVCAPDSEQYRVRQLDLPPAESLRAEMELAPGVKLGLRVVAGGASGTPAPVTTLRYKF